jgi:Transposase DDE domain
MEHQLWKEIVRLLQELDKPRPKAAQEFSDEAIVKVWYWAVLHDRPVRWACQRRNWPIHLRKQPLPSESWMSRRLRRDSVRALLAQLERRVVAPKEPGLYWMIDGKPLPIGGCSKDRQAGYGRAAAGKAKGYKLHALVNPQGEVAGWRVAPMNADERVMAKRLLKAAPEEVQGYVVTDSNYDSNPLHAVCEARPAGRLQLVNRRRGGAGHGLGHRKQTGGRLRNVELLENPAPHFGAKLLEDRAQIERYFGGLVNWGGGLTGLPPWVRTHRRVHRWVQAKLVLTALKRRLDQTTYVA